MAYKTEFQSNNADLQNVLNKINALPSLSSITPESIGAAKSDLSNVNSASMLTAIEAASAGDDGFYTKNETLNGSTKTEMGLEANATPNDAFLSLLGLMNSSSTDSNVSNDYVWAKMGISPTYDLEAYGTWDTTITCNYYDNISISTNLAISPVGAAKSNKWYLIPKGSFVYIEDDGITGEAYWVKMNDDITTASNPIRGIYRVRPKMAECVLGYVNSNVANAYPPTVSDGFTYKLLGQLGSAVGGAKIETGSYVGTGKYLSTNPNRLSFSFEPKIVIIQGSDTGSTRIIAIRGVTFVSSEVYSSRSVSITWSGTSMSWYSDNDKESQLNANGTTYYYVAIG